MCMYIYLSIYLPIYLSINQSIYLSILCTYKYIYMYMYIYIYMYTYMYTHISILCTHTHIYKLYKCFLFAFLFSFSFPQKRFGVSGSGHLNHRKLWKGSTRIAAIHLGGHEMVKSCEVPVVGHDFQQLYRQGILNSGFLEWRFGILERFLFQATLKTWRSPEQVVFSPIRQVLRLWVSGWGPLTEILVIPKDMSCPQLQARNFIAAKSVELRAFADKACHGDLRNLELEFVFFG